MLIIVGDQQLDVQQQRPSDQQSLLQLADLGVASSAASTVTFIAASACT